MILNDMEVAARLGSDYFKGEIPTVKRRVRGFLKTRRIEPIEKKEDVWLYLESDIFGIDKWPSSPQKGKARPTTRSPGRLAESAFEEAQRLLS